MFVSDLQYIQVMQCFRVVYHGLGMSHFLSVHISPWASVRTTKCKWHVGCSIVQEVLQLFIQSNLQL